MAGHRHAGKTDLRVLGCSRRNSGHLQGCGGTAASADGKRVEGIEPSSLAWKAIALPLSYTRAGMRLGSAGFEPAKAMPSDLQSDPVDRSGNSPLW